MTSPKIGQSRGNAGKGRKAGVPNKTTAALKDAILLAGAAVGADSKGTGGLQGYLETVAREDQKAFCGLLGKVLPMTVAGDPNNPLMVISKEQRDAAVAAATRADT
tara:strand:+ start:1817 stop:2134 length:318 start_codon:yes stop_codon:yes gene_type:complete